MTRVEGKVTHGSDLVHQYLYLPGVIVHTECQHCGRAQEFDLNSCPLISPTAGMTTLEYTCDGCGEFQDFELKLTISLEVP